MSISIGDMEALAAYASGLACRGAPSRLFASLDDLIRRACSDGGIVRPRALRLEVDDQLELGGLLDRGDRGLAPLRILST